MIMCTLCEDYLINDIVILIQCGHLYHIDCLNRHNEQNYTKICLNCQNGTDSIQIQFLIHQPDYIAEQQLNQLKIKSKSFLSKIEQEIELLIKNYKFLLLDYYIIVSDLQQLTSNKNRQINYQILSSKNKADRIIDDQDLFLSFQQQSNWNKKEQDYYQSMQDKYNKIYLKKIDYQAISNYIDNIENQNDIVIYFKDICLIQNQDENSYDKNLRCFLFQIFQIQNKVKNVEEKLTHIQNIIKQQTCIHKLCTLCSDKQTTQIAIRMSCGHIYHIKCLEMAIKQTYFCLNCLNHFHTSIVQFQVQDSEQIKIIQNKESFKWTLKDLEIRKIQLQLEISKHEKIDRDYAKVIENLCEKIKELMKTSKDSKQVNEIPQNQQDLNIDIIMQNNPNFDHISNEIMCLNSLFEDENRVPQTYDNVFYFVDICYPQNHCLNALDQNLQNLITKRKKLNERWELLEEQMQMTLDRLVDRYKWKQEQQNKRLGIRRKPPQTETKSLNERMNNFLGFPNNMKQYFNKFQQKQSDSSDEYSQTDNFF
ncbi:unnamed protein product (macronuclear) [Paramecium tetraurelia]|uniref:RING-type domain-containing protein n=1 Tax=Paramecium tetraurelia TaxID=5888 RepID=A0CH26_PARTE|nr:uncharacterized protein GSPATT00007533001 [Paramecium tetraurelia]CAK70093.1 unnamed protein product [Paramecium tetraurelia]|eukprot:XP_001437490.1 hypothetical protein (macronuclear) [Paramecium tetraurelia strain d4-2]